MTGVGALLGGALVLLSLRLFTADPGFLFAIMPIIASAALGAGLVLALWSVALVLSLLHRTATARLRTALLGASFAVVGLFVLFGMPWLGFGMAVYGLALLWLMCMPGAARDLGPWARAVRRQRAPWGQRPGTRVWSEEPPQQGPWSPDPTTLPWLPSQRMSGPQTPWWEVWRTGLQHGIPLWELLVLGGLLLVFLASLVAILAGARGLGVMGVVLSIAGVVPLEQRMRERAAGRR